VPSEDESTILEPGIRKGKHSKIIQMITSKATEVIPKKHMTNASMPA
jgi:hypothetical protein